MVQGIEGRRVLMAACESVALIEDESRVRAAVDAFWLAMVGRARAGLGVLDRLQLAHVVDAVLSEPAEPVRPIVRDAGDMASSYFTEGEAALLVPRSSQAPPGGWGPDRGSDKTPER